MALGTVVKAAIDGVGEVDSYLLFAISLLVYESGGEGGLHLCSGVCKFAPEQVLGRGLSLRVCGWLWEFGGETGGF